MEEKMIEKREHPRARVQRNSVLVENTKWVRPTGKAANPCRVTDMDCRKDLHGIFLYFNKQSFSVLG
jgi:hypothetical protein